MTNPGQIRGALAIIGPCMLIVGCGNVTETLTVDEWVIVDTNDATRGRVRVSLRQLEKGTGAIVQARSLVKIRVRTFSQDYYWKGGASPIRTSKPLEAWIWTGSWSVHEYGDFGSPDVRAALIGKSIGDKFVFEDKAGISEFSIPKYGMSHWEPSCCVSWYFGSANEVLIAGRTGSGAAWSEVEILNACPARFRLRKAKLKQWGYVFGWGDSRYPDSREGTLRWSMLDGKCSAPDGEIRFLMGPLYRHHTGTLYNWVDSYRAKRPSDKFPDEYQFVVIDGRPIDAAK